MEYRTHMRQRHVICLSKACRKKLAIAKQFAGMVVRVMFRVLSAAVITYLYAAWAIDQAYLQRGYRAYGGEFLIIPFVFYAVFKAIMFAEWLSHVVKQQIVQKEGRTCMRRTPEDVRSRE